LVQLTLNVVIVFIFLKVDHLTRKPKDGERSLREILLILHENDIWPFEVTQSGLVPALLTFLTKKVILNNFNFLLEYLGGCIRYTM
jgi:hypothetical protein